MSLEAKCRAYPFRDTLARMVPRASVMESCWRFGLSQYVSVARALPMDEHCQSSDFGQPTDQMKIDESLPYEFGRIGSSGGGRGTLKWKSATSGKETPKYACRTKNRETSAFVFVIEVMHAWDGADLSKTCVSTCQCSWRVCAHWAPRSRPPDLLFVSLKCPGLGACWTNKLRDWHEDRFTLETVTRAMVMREVCPNERPHRSRAKVSTRVFRFLAYPSSSSSTTTLLSKAAQTMFDSLLHYPLSLPHLLKVCEFGPLSLLFWAIGNWDMAVDQAHKILHLHLLVVRVSQ